MLGPLPTDAALNPDGSLTITWNDGAILAYPMDLLRASCPCAECVDEWTGEVRVSREQFPDIRLQALDEVGAYAFRIMFSDGHDLGIFTWKRLRELGV
jgi:DUF971 family protein